MEAGSSAALPGLKLDVAEVLPFLPPFPPPPFESRRNGGLDEPGNNAAERRADPEVRIVEAALDGKVER